MHFSGVLISISVPEFMTFPSFCVFSVVSGHKPSFGSPPYLPYWANSIEIVVPRGQFNWTYSWSQPALWYVLKVPDSKAGKKRKVEEYIDLWAPTVDLKKFFRFRATFSVFGSVFLLIWPFSKRSMMSEFYNIYYSAPKSYLNISRSSSFLLKEDCKIKWNWCLCKCSRNVWIIQDAFLPIKKQDDKICLEA